MRTAGDLLEYKKKQTFYVTPETTIEDALKVMTKNNIGAVLIKEHGKVVGIWTERDFLKNAFERHFSLNDVKMEDVMVKNVVFAQYNESIFTLMDRFLGLRFRHIPILKDSECLGILSSGDVMKAVMIEKDRELKDINSFVSWEYYENWRW